MSEKITLHCYISGKVQGVWFRASTKEEADKLGLTGWAKNLPDGRVEVLATGEKDKIAQLYEWLKHGPTLARVDDITREELPWQDIKKFTVI